jgi:hypothetical protein
MSDDSVNRVEGAGPGLVWRETLMRDLRCGVRALRKQPAGDSASSCAA